MRILIPTAGNRSLLIQSFRDQPGVEKVVTTEIDDLAPGAYAADKCYRVPRSADPQFLPALERICVDEKINLLVPLADLDLVRFSKERERFARLGVKVWANPQKTLDLALDKWRSYHLFHELHIPTPETYLFEDAVSRKAELTYPLYLKPRHASLKNSPRYFFSAVQGPDELEFFAWRLRGHEEDYLLQQSLASGKEINVDFFVQDGQLKRLVTLYRLKAGDGGGIIRGQTIPCAPAIRQAVEALIGAVEFHGATNIQAFEMLDGRHLVTEINARFSNSTALVARPAGVDLYALTIQMLQGKKIAAEFDNYRMIRVTSAYNPVMVEHSCFAA